MQINNIKMNEIQSILNNWGIKCDINIIINMWNEPGRYYHNIDHLNDLIIQIKNNIKDYNKFQYEELILTAIFHDIIYDPTRNDNEERSADFFMSCVYNKENKYILNIKRNILDTKTHIASSPISEIFIKYDMDILNRDFDKLLEWEKNIRKEYNIYSNDEYKEGRLEFIMNQLEKYNNPNLMKLIDWVYDNY